MIQIDLIKNLAVIEIQGQPTILNICEIVEMLLSSPGHTDGMDEVWDFRNASLANFTSEDLTFLAPFLARHLDRLGRRAALVVGRDLEYGIGQMWGAFAEEKAPRERRLFRSMEDAFQWLTPQADAH